MNWIEDAIRRGQEEKSAKKLQEDLENLHQSERKAQESLFIAKVSRYLDQSGKPIDKLAEELKQQGYQVENGKIGFHSHPAADQHDPSSVTKYGTNGDTGWWEFLSKQWGFGDFGRFVLISVGKENENLHNRGVFVEKDDKSTSYFKDKWSIYGSHSVELSEPYDKELRQILSTKIIEQIKHSK
jgi:hypothetical protein